MLNTNSFLLLRMKRLWLVLLFGERHTNKQKQQQKQASWQFSCNQTRILAKEQKHQSVEKCKRLWCSQGVDKCFSVLLIVQIYLKNILSLFRSLTLLLPFASYCLSSFHTFPLIIPSFSCLKEPRHAVGDSRPVHAGTAAAAIINRPLCHKQ